MSAATAGGRPDRIALICGTGTEVGKTWVASKVIEELRARGRSVAARKPAQSFDIDARGVRMGGATDAEVLGRASGEHPDQVCHPLRSYRRAMAPPMAADALGLPSFTVKELVDELVWPEGPTDVGIVELAGGVLSPQASDGDTTHFIRALRPDLVVLVSDAGLGTINVVRMSMAVLHAATRFEATEVGVGGGTVTSIPVVAVLDRFDARHDLHRRNLRWLTEEDGFDIVTLPGNVPDLADRLTA